LKEEEEGKKRACGGGFVFERVQFEGNEVGFQAPIGPRRMLFLKNEFFIFFAKQSERKLGSTCEFR